MSIANLLEDLNPEKCKQLLLLTDPEDIKELHAKAYQVKAKNVGKVVYFRGLIEASNICRKNCFYCGIRSGNPNFTRFEMTEEEIIKAALWSFESNYGSIVIQAGERLDQPFISKITRCLKEIKKATDGKLGITLSLGEQTEETYKEWFAAGAHRYLLRIESSTPELYAKLHPADHVYSDRIKCLDTLRDIGYQVGTGVMIGLPEQSVDDLVRDIFFFKGMDIDMIGMGPYQIHEDTPLADKAREIMPMDNLELALKMISICRILMPKVNIASTTALQALKHDGRELGLLAGANIIMPTITDIKYRKDYQLYKDKPCLDENADHCRFCLENRIRSIGEEIGYGQWGDSKHFHERK